MNRYDFLHASLKESAVIYAPYFVSLLVAAKYYKHSKIKILKGRLNYPRSGKKKEIAEYTNNNGWFWVRTDWLRRKIKHKRIKHEKGKL